MMDTYRHKGLRKQLVDEIRQKGIKDESILMAIDKIPRHLFMDSSFLEFAYEDKPFPIGSGQTISQPYTVAFQTELLEVREGDKILEIGTGSGYQACVLIELGAKVYSIERQKKLYTRTKELLPNLGYNPKLFYGDGNLGLPTFAPFDKIIITAGAPIVPDKLLGQLKIGGSMIIPLGKGSSQIMKRIFKVAENKFTETEHGLFRFVPLLNHKAND
ncbi:MAG: protein-L-isoaspartate O-methyltransferase [Bacteroidetes bacterium HGW-Bacteroidetes-17]|nr:MAG: protein-L-isoaspartate O-methyltransferase [Bacteroidetes bacterium HGW-Bacteroidetes-17]